VFSGVRQPWLQGIRLVSADRPGFGLSDRQPARTLLDWPGDMAALADHLGIDRFAVLGASGGGAYALACARLLPSRLTAAVVVSGMGPLDRPGATTAMALPNRLLYGLGRRAPLLLQALSRVLFAILLRRLSKPAAKSEAASTPSLDFMDDPAARPGLAAALAEALRQGTGGLVDEVALATHPWGFRLEEIAVPVQLWHGQDDRNVPADLARGVAAAIPGCHAVFVQGATPRPSHTWTDPRRGPPTPRATLTTGTGGDPGGCRAVDGLDRRSRRPGRERRCPRSRWSGGGRWPTGPPGWGCGLRRPRLPAE
jgi:pimeloyl-ACP methyl ester carboxylesterase